MSAGRTIIHFDGSARPNPGAITTALIHRGVSHIRGDLGEGDNSAAEWLALLHAVELAVGLGAQDVLFVGDSAVVIGQATGCSPCRSAHLQPFLAAYQAAVAPIARVRLRRVRRGKNLAGIALDRWMERAPPPTRD